MTTIKDTVRDLINELLELKEEGQLDEDTIEEQLDIWASELRGSLGEIVG